MHILNNPGAVVRRVLSVGLLLAKTAKRALVVIAWISIMFCAPPSMALGLDCLERAELYDVSLGSRRYYYARSARYGGYETANGSFVSFESWYSPNYPELNVKVRSPLSSGLSLIWGLSTGSRAEKFTIQPGVWLGLDYATELTNNVFLVLNAMTLIGGRLTEHPCNADYGSFGTFSVNCRLAASHLSPEATLEYLFRESGQIESSARLMFLWMF